MIKKVIGLTGPVQTGKQELGYVFNEFGISFTNLNSEGDLARSTYLKDEFERLVPKGFYPNGWRNAEYYLKVCQTPGLFDQIMDIELPVISKYARKSISGGMNVVLSWEYLYLLSNIVYFDHIIIFHCADQNKWYDRLLGKSKVKGFNNPSKSLIETIIREHYFDRIIPNSLNIWNDKCILVDTSSDDWGEANLSQVLEKIL